MATLVFLFSLCSGCGENFTTFGSDSGGGGAGAGGQAGSTSTATGGGGGTGGQGGSSTTATGGGGSGGDAGGQGGEGGMGGQGGSGGTDCGDPPANNALTFPCTNACMKIVLLNGGAIVNAESSANDDACETKLPFATHPTSGQVVGVWVKDPATNNAFTAQSLGSYPSICNVKCGPAPNPGPAPNHMQMDMQLKNGGFTMVSCGSNPTVSLALNCPNGMYAAMQF